MNARGGMAVVDRDPEAPVADPLEVDRVEDVLRVALPHAGRVARLPTSPNGGTAELLAAEVLLDLLLQRVGVIWMPGRSKNLISMISGSALDRPTWTPAGEPCVFRT